LLPGELDRPLLPAARKGRPAEIVAAARQLLGQDGRDALTMRRLAGVLGIQAPSLYKHFPDKAALELAIIEDVLVDIGEASHAAIHSCGPDHGLERLLEVYRRHGLSHPHLYRLATEGPLARQDLAPGLEEWAGNPWYVVTGDPFLAQAVWSFAHGMVVLELDGRYPPDSDLDATWRAGAGAFESPAARGRARLRAN
jgi:AcrR family transcriptional regulator